MTSSGLGGCVAVDTHSPESLPGIDPLPVPAETVHGELSAYGWRYYGLEGVPYERHMCLLGGGLGMVFTGLVSTIANNRRRRLAEALAEPRWWPLGLLRIAYTAERLHVWHREAWWSIWLAAVVRTSWDPAGAALELFFNGETPYRMAGPEVESLALWLGVENRGTLR